MKHPAKRLTKSLPCAMLMVLAAGCSQESWMAQYKELSWEELVPENEVSIDHNPDQRSDLSADLDFGLESLDVVDGGFAADQYSNWPGLSDGYYGGQPQAYSVGIIPELNGKNVRLPGFIVPVEFDSDQAMTAFFLVPYFGACFHKPPPPPNQTLYVSRAEPIMFESIYDPVWVMGVINTEQKGTDIATAAYSMDFHALEAYTQW